MLKKNKWLFTLVLIPITELLRFLAKQNTQWVESVYSKDLYLRWMQGLSSFYGAIPISVGEVLAFSYVCGILFLLIQAIGDTIGKKKEGSWHTLFRFIVVSVSLVYFFFFINYGVNFYREPIAIIDEAQVLAMDEEGLAKALSYYIKEANVYAESFERQLTPTPSYDEIFEKANESYYYLPSSYRYMTGVYGTPKRIILSDLQASMGYTGMFFMLTGEPLVNSKLVRVDVPYTVCHEIAHQRGVAKEYEASYIGFLACIRSPEPFFNYSGYFNAIKVLGNELRKADLQLYEETMEQCHPYIIRDLQSVSDFWSENYNPKVAEKVDVVVEKNLTNHGEEDGLLSYGQVAKYMLDYYINLKNK